MLPTLSPLALFLAQTPPPLDAAAQGQAFIFLGGLVAVAVMGNQVMGAIVTFRKLRGNDPQADGRYATKSELINVEKTVEGLRGEVRAQALTLSNELRAIHRALGRIEGRLGSGPSIASTE
jgi:hypothetical protein